jgi:hypothetical protein
MRIKRTAYAMRKFRQGTCGHGRACAHEDSNLTALRLFHLRSIRGLSPLTNYAEGISGSGRFRSTVEGTAACATQRT